MVWRRIKKSLSVLIIIICFYFIFRSLYFNWASLKVANLKFCWEYLVLSYFFMFATLVLVAYTWKKNLAMLNENISLTKALQINALATLPKYAPGKVWGIAGKVYLANKEGISAENCVITITLETILYLLGGIILFLLTSVSQIKGHISLSYLLLIPVFLVIIYPKFFIKITNYFLKLLKRPLINVIPNYLQILVLLLLYTLSWIFQGIGIFFLIKSFYPIGVKYLMLISGLHAFSWVVGFLSIITPAGLGVKEGVFSYFLSFILPTSIAAISAILVRIWGTIGEILYFFVYSTKIKKYLRQ
ncbi:MAG: lysylphosphatidylglycerol synthase domain-containing protein [candidate division WOR-3 bacterium]|nr:lysylphosphatidylglycerol synthase domain-containing protein [candidate division WOR-3 bacterium]MCX7757865.1 lysylphosphatidylglycerol synthase domain-containing protein [candidate division WOR-3 bacterium]MDW7988356.1 lysylphosphatidylglycerol synthase domain-containing protein [candidate division WOR-3 bacterium]